jgi:hypothetical protein
MFLLNFWRCWGKDHLYRYDGPTLGGDWIKCDRCGHLDEYLPGVHEPKGYKGEKNV